MKPGLGCIPDLPDQRDRVSSAPAVLAATNVPVAYSLNVPIPIFNQGNIGSCTGFGIARAFRALLRIHGHPVYQPSQLFIYYNERVIENTVNSDAGAQIRNGMKVIVNTGAADIVYWNYIPHYFRSKPSPRAYKNALTPNHRAFQYARVSNILADIKRAIMVSPVIIGFAVYDSFYRIGSDGVMPGPSGRLQGGHCVTVEGWDDTKQRFLCANSWGTSWGSKGYFYIPYSIMQNSDMVYDLWSIEQIV